LRGILLRYWIVVIIKEVNDMKTKRALVIFSLLVFFISIPAYGDGTKHGDAQMHKEHQAMMKDTQAKDDMNVDIELYDLELVTQDGKRVKFKSDVIGDKLVAMTFIFTSCTTICPVYNAIFTRLQPMLGDRLGSEVILVTMTVDPTTDVPRRMKKEAKKYKAQPGWIYLTGKKHNVDQVLKGLDAYFADFTTHPPMALVGDGKTGTWKRYNGFPKPEQLLAMIDELKAARE
jgi:protein SCO1/2